MSYFQKKLGWVETGLRVSYRASAEPQRLAIDIDLPHPGTQLGLANLIDVVASGGGGGAAFPPSAGKCKLVSGNLWDVSAHHAFVLEVAGVDPLFLRWIVEQLALSGEPGAIGLSLRGSLPADGTAMSAGTDDVRRWLRDPDAFPAQAPGVPFAVDANLAKSNRQARMAVTFVRAPTKAELNRFRLVWMMGDAVVAAGLNMAGNDYPPGSGARLARAGVEVKMSYTELDIRPRPALDLWVNLLHRFHLDVVPIERLEIALAGLAV